MDLSVCILTSGRLQAFQKCLQSARLALPAKSEITVIVNGSQPETVKWLESEKDSRVSFVEVPHEPRTRSRNRAFDLCKGKILYFLDDDVIVPSHLFKYVLEVFSDKPHLSVIGGPNLTPRDSSFLEKAFGAVMTSFFAAPMVRVRYGAKHSAEVNATDSKHLILCNLAVRAADIPKEIRFKEKLSSNEENLFLFHCTERHLNLAFASDAYVYHRRRKTLKAFFAQVFSYGKGRGQQTRISPASCHLLFWIPALSILMGAALLIFSATREMVPELAAVYFGFSFLGSVSSPRIRQTGVFGILSACLLTAVVHFSYGLGFLSGIASVEHPFMHGRGSQLEVYSMDSDYGVSL